MKTMIISFSMFVVLVLSCMCLSSLFRKQCVIQEANEALSVAIRHTMELWVDDVGMSEEEMIDSFLMDFKIMINSDSIYRISFIEIDSVNGLMDVKCDVEYDYINGKTGKVSLRKTLIFN